MSVTVGKHYYLRIKSNNGFFDNNGNFHNHHPNASHFVYIYSDATRLKLVDTFMIYCKEENMIEDMANWTRVKDDDDNKGFTATLDLT